MTLHLGLPHAHHRSAEQQHEIREARRMLKERVRDDWEYPHLPAYQTPTTRRTEEKDINARIAGFRFHGPPSPERGETLVADLDFEPVEWRERDYSSEEDGDEAEAEVRQASGSAHARTTSTSSGDHHQHKKLSNIFKFEGPDSVGHQIEEHKAAKRQKRQKALDEEVEWNDGLAHWLARRDAWCCARTTTQVSMLENKSQSSIDATPSASGPSAGTSPRTSTSTASSITPSATASSPSTTPDIAPSASPPTIHAASILPTHPSAPPSHALIPLAPRLLPDHPIRKRISPDLYPEIYSKIIISGRTPSVPINLLTLTRALVQGWKDDGEWPPKQGPVEKSIGRKKGGKEGGESSLRSGVRAVGRVLRITGTGADGGKEKEKEKEKG